MLFWISERISPKFRQQRKEIMQKIAAKGSEETAKVDKLLQDLEKTETLKEAPNVTLKVISRIQ